MQKLEIIVVFSFIFLFFVKAFLPLSSSWKHYSVHMGNCINVQGRHLYQLNMISNLTSEQENLLKQLGEPLLDFELVKQTIEAWTKPLPVTYLTMPLIIAGPSAVGKGRLIKQLMYDYSRFFYKVVTHTTRTPRPGETNGTHYHFITRDEFLERVNKSLFIEWSPVHDNLYGVSVDAWKSAQQLGKIPILEIDIKGAKTIKRESRYHGVRPHYLFIAPPDISKLRERLLIRGTESPEQVELRLKNAFEELELCKKEKIFDRIIINDDLEDARNALFRAVRDWYPAIPSASRIRMMQRRLKKIKEVVAGQVTASNTRLSGNPNT
jgi:guanylate kinase